MARLQLFGKQTLVIIVPKNKDIFRYIFLLLHVGDFFMSNIADNMLNCYVFISPLTLGGPLMLGLEGVSMKDSIY